MTLIEAFVRDNVYIDFGSEILYGEDQANIDYPSRFPTVGFQLIATDALCKIADRIRMDAGFKPMHAMDEYTDDTCDNNGWYDFYVGLNGFSPNHMDSCIEFVVVNSDSGDNEQTYTIDLSPDDQNALFDRLNEQCRDYLGQTCEDLLAEAKKQMEEDTEYILDDCRLIICQSNACSKDIRRVFPQAEINPLGDWKGGTNVDTGATNRKLGSDMGDSITGGGLHGKDLSKADVSVNIYAWLKAQAAGKPVEISCAIGDGEVDGLPYSLIVALARDYISELGGFEKFAEWGLLRY